MDIMLNNDTLQSDIEVSTIMWEMEHGTPEQKEAIAKKMAILTGPSPLREQQD